MFIAKLSIKKEPQGLTNCHNDYKTDISCVLIETSRPIKAVSVISTKMSYEGLVIMSWQDP